MIIGEIYKIYLYLLFNLKLNYENKSRNSQKIKSVFSK